MPEKLFPVNANVSFLSFPLSLCLSPSLFLARSLACPLLLKPILKLHATKRQDGIERENYSFSAVEKAPARGYGTVCTRFRHQNENLLRGVIRALRRARKRRKHSTARERARAHHGRLIKKRFAAARIVEHERTRGSGVSPPPPCPSHPLPILVGLQSYAARLGKRVCQNAFFHFCPTAWPR